MLGRQQIAGIPTAISELFKNAHDAYADRVEVDYYRREGLFVLRDNGSRNDERAIRGSLVDDRHGDERRMEAVPSAPGRKRTMIRGLSWAKKESVAWRSRRSLPRCLLTRVGKRES